MINLNAMPEKCLPRWFIKVQYLEIEANRKPECCGTLTWSEEKNIDQVMEDRLSEPVKDLQVGSSWYSLICWCCYLCGVYYLVILGKLLQGRRNSFRLTMTETSRRAMQHIYHEFCIVCEKMQTRICTQICTEGAHERSLVSSCLLQFIMTFRCFYV